MSSFAVLALMASSVIGQAGAHPHQAELAAWGRDFGGEWVNELVLDRDAGPLKKGTKGVAQMSAAWSEDKECLTIEYSIELQGKVVNTTKGIVGWDPAKDAVLLRWFNSWGGSGEITYKRDGSGWISHWEATEADGAKSSWTDTIECTPTANHSHLADRVVNGEKLPDKVNVWKRRK